MRPVSTLIVVLSTLFGACIFNEKTAGGAQDFPNSLEVASSWSTFLMGKNDNWNILPEMAAPLPPATGNLQTDSIPSHNPSLSRLKITAAQKSLAEDPWVPLDHDTITYGPELSNDTIVVYRYRDDIAVRILDTAWIKNDNSARDSIWGNELVYKVKGEIWWKWFSWYQKYLYEDRDRDGRFDWRKTQTRFGAKDTVAKIETKIELAGPDGSFAGYADNLNPYSAWGMVDGPDTLIIESARDADGDGMIWHVPGIDTFYINYSQHKYVDTLNPDAALQKLEAKVLFDINDLFRPVPIKGVVETVLKSGKSSKWKLSGNRADSTFRPGDSATIKWHEKLVPGDTLQEVYGNFKVFIKEDFFNFNSHSLYQATLGAKLSAGTLEEISLTYEPDSPVTTSSPDLSGNVGISFFFNHPDRETFTGRFDGTWLEGTYKSATESEKKVRWGPIR